MRSGHGEGAPGASCSRCALSVWAQCRAHPHNPAFSGCGRGSHFRALRLHRERSGARPDFETFIGTEVGARARGHLTPCLGCVWLEMAHGGFLTTLVPGTYDWSGALCLLRPWHVLLRPLAPLRVSAVQSHGR